jgi:hypothetical protein
MRAPYFAEYENRAWVAACRHMPLPIPLGQTMATTGHRLTKTMMRYYKVEDLLNSEAAKSMARGRAQREKE